MKKTKIALSMVLAFSMFTGNLSGIYANTVNTEYDFIKLDRPKPTPIGEEIIKNGNFDNGSSHWIERDGGSIKEGKVLLPKSKKAASVHQTVEVKPNTDYVVKAKFNVSEEKGQGILAIKAGNLKYTIQELLVGKTNGDEIVELKFNSGDRTTVEIAVLKWESNPGVVTSDIYADNISLKETSVLNGDFELGQENWLLDKAEIEDDGTGNKHGVLNIGQSNSIFQEQILDKNTDYILKAKVAIEKSGGEAFVAIKQMNNQDIKPTKVEKKIEYGALEDSENYKYQDVELKFNSGENTNVKIGVLKWAQTTAAQNSKVFVDEVLLAKQNTDDGNEYDDNYDIVWADDFNGNELDYSKWEHELGDPRNGEQQHYVKNKENIFLDKDDDGGHLTIKLTSRDTEDVYKNHKNNKPVMYNSASIRTHGKQEFLYGRAEIRAKLPEGYGVFPAFWMLGADFNLDDEINGEQGPIWPRCGEIDIMELMGKSGSDRVVQTVHYDGGNGNHITDSRGAYKLSNGVFNNQYHVFGFNWYPNKMEWYVDDQIVATFDYSNNPAAQKCFNRPQYIQLNLATGASGGAWDSVDKDPKLDGKEYNIDYIYYGQNAEQKKAAEEYYQLAPTLSGVKDITMIEGDNVDLLNDISVDKEGYALDYTITNSPMFEQDNETHQRVDIVCNGKKESENVSKLSAGTYTIYYSAYDSNGFDKFARKSATLTIKEKITYADYSRVDEAIAQLPEDLSIYSDESVQSLNDAIKAVERGLKITEQDKVNAMVESIEKAINGLSLKEADYSQVDEIISQVPEDLSVYSDESVQSLNDAIKAVERGLKITEQDKVNAMAESIEKAINGLSLKEADYSQVDEIISQVPEDLSIYSDESVQSLNDAIKAVERGLKITDQDKVNAMAESIEKALKALELKPKEQPSIDVDPISPSDPVSPNEPVSPIEPSPVETEKNEVGVTTADYTHIGVYVAICSLGILGCMIALKKKKS